MNRKKILYTGEPILTTYDIYGNLTSIASDQKNFYDWIYNNFINICYLKYANIYYFDSHFTILYNCPWIFPYAIPKKFLEDKWNKSLKSFIIDSIDLDCYLYFHVDRFYIPEADAYNNSHVAQTIFVYGYDLDENIVYAAENIKAGKYTLFKVNFDDMEKAYFCCEFKDSNDQKDKPIYLFRKSKNVSYYLDLMEIKTSFHHYLHSTYTHKTPVFRPDATYINEDNIIRGFNTIDYLIESIQDNKQLDIRVFHLLWEHKAIMIGRLKFMEENGYLKNGEYFNNAYAELEPKYLALRNMALKYNIIKDNNILNRIRKNLKEYVIIEKELVKGIIENIVINSNQNYTCNDKYMYPSDWVKVNDTNYAYLKYNDDCRTITENRLCKVPAGYTGMQEDWNGIVHCIPVDSYYEITFTGTGLDIISPLLPRNMKIKISLDGKVVNTVIPYSNEKYCQQLIYKIKELPYKTHTARIDVLTGVWWYVADCFIVYGEEIIPVKPELNLISGNIIISNINAYDRIDDFGGLQYTMDSGETWLDYNAFTGIAGLKAGTYNISVRYAGKDGAPGLQPFYYNAPNFSASQASEVNSISIGHID